MTSLALEDVYLRPGDIYFGKGANVVVRTLLGSCVAITLWHPLSCFGGMCHVTMPSRGFTGPLQQLNTAYADEAMRYFMTKLTLFKLRPAEFEVRLYGGGVMFDSRKRATDVGANNVKAMLSQIDLQGFTLLEKNCAGNVYRKLWLTLSDGKVKLVEESVNSKKPVVSS